MDSAHHKHLIEMGFDPSALAATLEKPLRKERASTLLRIGVPKERHFQEARVALTPGAVGVLVANGHEVFVEHNAGIQAQFVDRDYTEQGAQIATSTKDLYAKSNIIAKITPLTTDELEFLQRDQILVSALHLGSTTPEYLKALIAKNITALGFEYIQAKDGSIPFMQMMSEIAGISSIHIGSEMLCGRNGKGVLLGGITGVPPANVTVIGAGTVGYHATRTAIGLGAFVRVFDEEVYRLRVLEETLGMKVWTCVSQQDIIAQAIADSDVVIGAAFKKGGRAPLVVTEDMVANMKEGSVIVDVAIDQGGNIETSSVTNHQSPTLIKHGVIHYCVPNIPSRVPVTASSAISNILCPMLLKIGYHGGLRQTVHNYMPVRTGIYVYSGHITQRNLAGMFNMDFMDIDLLYAAQL